MTNSRLWKLAGAAAMLVVAFACSSQRATPVVAPIAEAAAPAAPPAAATEPAGEPIPTQPAPASAAEAGGDPEVVPGELIPEEETALEAADLAETASAATEPEPATLLHESLDQFESSKAHWEQGDLDAAFAALDQAYELMAAVPPTGDPLLSQEKENLRRLISRRIVEIYASRQSAVGNPNGSIPLVVNDDVRARDRELPGARAHLLSRVVRALRVSTGR